VADVGSDVVGIRDIVMNIGSNDRGVRIVMPNVRIGCMRTDPKFGLGESYQRSYSNDRTYVKDLQNPL